MALQNWFQSFDFNFVGHPNRIFVFFQYLMSKSAQKHDFGPPKWLPNQVKTTLKSTPQSRLYFSYFLKLNRLSLPAAKPWKYKCFINKINNCKVFKKIGFAKFMCFAHEKPPRNLSKTRSKPWKSRVWKRLAFRHWYVHAWGSILEALEALGPLWGGFGRPKCVPRRA